MGGKKRALPDGGDCEVSCAVQAGTRCTVCEWLTLPHATPLQHVPGSMAALAAQRRSEALAVRCSSAFLHPQQHPVEASAWPPRRRCVSSDLCAPCSRLEALRE
jgi:hypothetical protein